MKLREALIQINHKELFSILCDLELELSDVNYTLEECEAAYSSVIQELLATPNIPTANKIVVEWVNGGEISEKYIDVHLLNELAYTEKVSSLGGKAWEQIASAGIENRTALDLIQQVAYILWELTYDGWTEQEQREFHNHLIAKIMKTEKDE